MGKINKTRFKFIYLEITNYCNLSCYFCPSSTLKVHNYMKMDDIVKYIMMIKNYTDTVYLHILGEPLTHPNFKDIVRLCDENHLKVRVTTNATLIKQYNFEEINVTKLNISLQSLINFPRSYLDEYFKNINVLLHEVSDKLKTGKLGIDFRMWNDKNNVEVQNLNKLIKNYLVETINIGAYPNVRLSEEDEFTWPNEMDDYNYNDVKCLGGKTHLGVHVNGDVVLCCLDYQDKTIIGNINEQTLDEILCGDLYQKAMTSLQAGKAYFPLCASCLYRNRFNRK